MARLNVNDARRAAVFASGLQPSDALPPGRSATRERPRPPGLPGLRPARSLTRQVLARELYQRSSPRLHELVLAACWAR
jgi:hypothetical protein